MLTPVFEGKDYGYCVDKDKGEYVLFSDKYKICLTLTDKDARVFASHIQLIKNENDDKVNDRIEKAICIYLYYSSLGHTGDTRGIIPIFKEE